MINFLVYKCFHCFCFVYFEIIQTQNRRLNSVYMQKSSLQSYQTQIKILAYPGLTYSGDYISVNT